MTSSIMIQEMVRHSKKSYDEIRIGTLLQSYWPPERDSVASLFNLFKSLWTILIQEHQSLRIEHQSLRKKYEQLLKENQRLTHEVNHDNLTGLYNRRYCDAYMEKNCAAISLSGYKLFILVIDVDHFKQYNDAYGHQAGDQLLRKIGKSLSSVVPRADHCIARYGGEEFVAVLPGYNQMSALEIAKNIQRVITALGVTVSIGVASYGKDGKVPFDLLACADQRLYAAKRNGRNRVEISEL